MEYFAMFVSHLIKTAHYFIVEGMPEIPIEYIPEAIEGVVFNFIKLATIYFSMFG